jgi:hypothetical protein
MAGSILSSPNGCVYSRRSKSTTRTFYACIRSGRGCFPCAVSIAVVVRKFTRINDQSRAAIGDLIRLERYERRAWSRQKRAIREFIALRFDRNSRSSAA